ncbi:hypothetical protein MKW94_021402 [Papaver nudicaule]|uniref:Putative plant transposon protein domain-containing protein n=1 Tax=Papaver nudicaule TaxID=74823 RepID=A0AA41S0S4_PAPNU|nr:hypothetical protein [Papaver nudicaule]
MIKSLLHIRGSAPISPVQLFYSQIHDLSVENESFDVYIEGKVHKITPQVIASLLGFDRPLEPFRRAVYLPEHVNSDGRHTKREIKVAHLKPIIAVLVRICQSNILPALNHHYITNLNSVYLSFLLLKGYQVDISYVIWHTMAHLDRVKTKSVPYGIIVGQLLSYLGHPFPADTPCTSVPGAFDVNFLCRNNLRYDPCDSNDRALSKPHSNDISPPPPPLSRDAGDASELPQTLPNDPPIEFVCLSESIQSLKESMEVIFSHVVTRQDRFEKQQQDMIDCIARENDRREQQYVNPICQECGDSGYVELLIYCNLCQTSAGHSYCLYKLPKNDGDEIIWTCEDCEQTAELKTRQGVEVTSSKEVIEDIGQTVESNLNSEFTDPMLR